MARTPKRLTRGPSRAAKPKPVQNSIELDELMGEVKPEVVTAPTPAPAAKPVKGKEDWKMGQLRHGHPEQLLPVCPIKRKKSLGDKDPRVVEWWRDNHPELYNIKYERRQTHLNPDVFTKDADEEDEGDDD